MTTPEPPEPPLRELSAFVGATRPARSRKERIEMTTPEPSPLSEQELKALEEYTRSLVCCVCDGPDSDGNHDDDCQAPFWQKVSRAIAQARAARPSPWLLSRADAEDILSDRRIRALIDHGDLKGSAYRVELRRKVLELLWPSPPAQDGGRP